MSPIGQKALGVELDSTPPCTFTAAPTCSSPLEPNDPHLAGGLTGFFDSFDSRGGQLTCMCDDMTGCVLRLGLRLGLRLAQLFVV